MKNTKRALRRHHRQRMIQRAYRSFALRHVDDEEERRKYLLRWYNNMAKCHCWMCRNPRWRDGLTTQERRSSEAARYELSEWAGTSAFCTGR